MTAFYEEKGWWKSKTIWMGIAAAVYSALQIVGIEAPFGVDLATVNNYILGIFGVVAIFLRTVTTQPISSEVLPTTA